MSSASEAPLRESWLKVAIPLALGAIVLLAPTPAGLSVNAWRYFALFATVIVGLITEPIPPAIIGMGGVIVAAALGLVRDTPAQSAQWALSGFGNATVWLIFAGYMFTLGYTQTGLGRRIALHLVRLLGGRTLGLGYAVALADLALAPFTASATARSAGTVFPIVRQIPELYASRPDDGTARRLGAYLLYTALVASIITSSMFVTALAPNTLAVSVMRQTAGVTVSWLDWFIGFAPVGFTLIALTPFLLYKIYPPEIRSAPEAPRWAAEQLRAMGAMSRKELTLLVLVCSALALWIGAIGVRRAGGHRDARRAADGDLQRRVVERRDRTLAGVERPGLVRDAGDARRRTGGDEVPRLARAVARAHAPEFSPGASRSCLSSACTSSSTTSSRASPRTRRACCPSSSAWR